MVIPFDRTEPGSKFQQENRVLVMRLRLKDSCSTGEPGIINPDIKIPDLAGKVAEVIDTLGTQEHEVQDREKRWYSLPFAPTERWTTKSMERFESYVNAGRK